MARDTATHVPSVPFEPTDRGPIVRTVALSLPAKEAVLPGAGRVLRALPRRERRRVGPFVFLDHAGPARVDDAHRIVGAHPHVGLQTLSYLLEGRVEHQDSLGSIAHIGPGDVNWMTAGRAIVHAEKLASEVVHLLQLWVALPPHERLRPPSFAGFPASSIPSFESGGARVRVVAGALDGGLFASRPLRSPVPEHHPHLALDLELAPGARLVLPVDPSFELAAYVVEGPVAIGGTRVDARTLALLSDGGESLETAADGPARVFVLGGKAMPEPSVTWWNFVVDDVAAGRALEEKWKAGDFEGADWKPSW